MVSLPRIAFKAVLVLFLLVCAAEAQGGDDTRQPESGPSGQDNGGNNSKDYPMDEIDLSSFPLGSHS